MNEGYLQIRNIDDDMEKLELAFFQNLQRNYDCEYGSIGLDCKRPFGNSDVEGNILEIIGETPEIGFRDFEWSERQLQYAATLYNNLPRWLKIKYGQPKDQ